MEERMTEDEKDETIRRAIATIENQPDRSAAIVLAAIVEDALGEAIISRRFLDDPPRIRKMMRGDRWRTSRLK